MRFLTQVLFLCFSTSYAYCACAKIPCPSAIAQCFERIAESTLEKSYQSVNNTLKNVKEQYDDLLKNLKESNKSLELAINLNQHKFLKEKELVFLLKQFNALQGTQNGIRAENFK